MTYSTAIYCILLVYIGALHLICHVRGVCSLVLHVLTSQSSSNPKRGLGAPQSMVSEQLHIWVNPHIVLGIHGTTQLGLRYVVIGLDLIALGLNAEEEGAML